MSPHVPTHLVSGDAPTRNIESSQTQIPSSAPIEDMKREDETPPPKESE